MKILMDLFIPFLNTAYREMGFRERLHKLSRKYDIMKQRERDKSDGGLVSGSAFPNSYFYGCIGCRI